MAILVLGTPSGPAHAHISEADERRGVVVLGHGAGGGIGAKDLVGAKDVAVAAGLSVALVEQPYRVAGRRSAPPAANLDVAWTAVVEALRRIDALRLCTPVSASGLHAKSEDHPPAGDQTTHPGIERASEP